MKRQFLSVLFICFSVVSAAYGYECEKGGSGVPAGWSSTLAGDGEFMIFLHPYLRYNLEKVEVTIEKLEGTTLYTGTTLVKDGTAYYASDPFSCTDYLTLSPIIYVKDSDFLSLNVQLNKMFGDKIGHVGHSYDTLQAGQCNRDYILGYGTYEIRMKFYHTPTSYSNQRWVVDLKDPNYPYHTHDYPTYYDICFCVNPGNTNDYTASAYLTNVYWQSWIVILPNHTGKLSDAFCRLSDNRSVVLGVGPGNFEHIPLSVYITGNSVMYARDRSSSVKSSANRDEGNGLISFPKAHAATATATYTAYPSCGTQQYTYRWELKKPGWTNWVYQGSGKSVTITQTSDFYIRCTVTSDPETAADMKFVKVIVISDSDK